MVDQATGIYQLHTDDYRFFMVHCLHAQGREKHHPIQYNGRQYDLQIYLFRMRNYANVMLRTTPVRISKIVNKEPPNIIIAV